MSKIDWDDVKPEYTAFCDGKFITSKEESKIVYVSKAQAYLNTETLNIVQNYEQRPPAWPEVEARINAIGQNGNDGEHYQQEPAKTAADFLSEGLRILSERGKQYGSEGNERSFAQVAQAFTAVTGKQLVGSDICLILALVKQVRQYAQPRYHHDSAVDSVNYVALQAEELQKERA